ncbi:Zinc finger E-box-binding homeobox 1 [Cyphomyrmex costatus]|uniref:Zinc finger E-box-binding homeobox 1 n=1 Tax=Cyphomyrmex costatus TaxID=456900 RepID=A0A195CRZ3_9HYME|nr:Zinc finger E-box-binding homeobox 1 [Cyphomyrmex costatus]
MCPHCKKIYAPRSLLRKHMQFACKMNPRNTTTFSCTFCPYKSIYKANMERHVSNVHNTGSLKFSCELCNFRSNYSFCVRRHLYHGTRTLPFTRKLHAIATRTWRCIMKKNIPS